MSWFIIYIPHFAVLYLNISRYGATSSIYRFIYIFIGLYSSKAEGLWDTSSYSLCEDLYEKVFEKNANVCTVHANSRLGDIRFNPSV